MRFNIVHIVAGLRVAHGLLGHAEVIETVKWGLIQLGYDVTVGVNKIEPDRINIIVGGQMLTDDSIQKLPANTIVYNFEQLGGAPPDAIRPSMHQIARRFWIWDYSAMNFDAWRSLKCVHEPIHVPIGFAPLLARIPKQKEDIDVLFYGLPSNSRLKIFNDLCRVAPTCLFACGVYFRQRDELIARSRIVLNITQFPNIRIFEIVRISFLLANEKAVVSDIFPDSRIEPDLTDAVAFAAPEQIVETCAQLLADTEKRRAFEKRGAEIFRRRDIREILRTALDSMK
jgi:hypothetical protein